MEYVNEMPGHLLLFSQTEWDRGLSAEEMEGVMQRFMVWYDQLLASGELAGGFPLLTTRTRVGAGGNVVDGPFPETKETVGGYLELKTSDPAVARAIASSNPLLDLGVTIEIRRPAAECPTFLRVMQQVAAARKEKEQSRETVPA
jgi:hypothetical protein